MAADYGIQTINWTSVTETILRASNVGMDDKFGQSVAISGNYAIVGAWYEDGTSTSTTHNSGAAYIFDRTGGSWIQTQILTPSSLDNGDIFGQSVAMSGNYAIVGAAYDDGTSNNISNCGAAYIFERDGSGSWNQKQILRASNPDIDDNFSYISALAISDTYAVVGARGEDGSSNTISYCGAIYIFKLDSTTGIWNQTQLIRSSNIASTLSYGVVSISNNYLIVGASYATVPLAGVGAGEAYIYELNTSTGIWDEVIVLRASDATANDGFGDAVAISGNYAIVGASGEDGAANNTSGSGAAYIFERNITTGIWSQTQQLRASNTEFGDQFGKSVAISGIYAVVGARGESGVANATQMSGAVYIFARNMTTGVWSQTSTILRASNLGSYDYFGNSVAISGKYIIAGADGEDGTNVSSLVDSGAAYIYEGVASVTLTPSPLSFVNNTLTIANSIDSTDTDPVSFSLTSGTTLTSLNVSAFSGSGTVTYNLDISGGANIVTAGTFSATNVNLLTGGPLTASVNTTYNLTLTADASITYSIFGLLVTGAFTYSKLVTSGFTIAQLTAAGYNIVNLKANGITDAQLLGAGYTIALYAAEGLLPDWNIDASASHIIKSYVTGFVDMSGSVVLRNNANLYVHGNAQLGGNLSLNRPAIETDLSFNNQIFVGGDVSMNGNVNIGGNISLTGSVVNCSNVANDSVPQSAFNGSVSSGPDYTAARVAYRQNFQANDDVSMNGTIVQANNVRVNGNIVFSDGTIMNSYDNNIFSTNPTVFKPSTFTSLAINGNLTAGSYSTSSDYRIKTEVAQLDETVNVDNLRPVKYVQTLINKTQYGLIAHELQEYYPDLVVGEKDGDGWQRVNYTGLIAILINEIKRIKQDLAELEGEN